MKRFLLILLIALLAIGAYFGFRMWKQVFGPGPRFSQTERILLIPTGATFDQVMDSLKANGIIKEEGTFRMLAKRKKYGPRVKPGRYVIPSGTNLNTLVNKLRSGEQDPVHITFTNIRRLPQLAGQVDKYLECDSADLIKAMHDPAVVDKLGFRSETIDQLVHPEHLRTLVDHHTRGLPGAHGQGV